MMWQQIIYVLNQYRSSQVTPLVCDRFIYSYIYRVWLLLTYIRLLYYRSSIYPQAIYQSNLSFWLGVFVSLLSPLHSSFRMFCQRFIENNQNNNRGVKPGRGKILKGNNTINTTIIIELFIHFISSFFTLNLVTLSTTFPSQPLFPSPSHFPS